MHGDTYLIWVLGATRTLSLAAEQMPVLCCLLRRSLILGGIIVKTMHLQQHDNLSLYGPMSSSAWFPSGRFANHLTIVNKDEY